jgi:hypothetical protein
MRNFFNACLDTFNTGIQPLMADETMLNNLIPLQESHVIFPEVSIWHMNVTYMFCVCVCTCVCLNLFGIFLCCPQQMTTLKVRIQ